MKYGTSRQRLIRDEVQPTGYWGLLATLRLTLLGVTVLYSLAAGHIEPNCQLPESSCCKPDRIIIHNCLSSSILNPRLTPCNAPNILHDNHGILPCLLLMRLAGGTLLGHALASRDLAGDLLDLAVAVPGRIPVRGCRSHGGLGVRLVLFAGRGPGVRARYRTDCGL